MKALCDHFVPYLPRGEIGTTASDRAALDAELSELLRRAHEEHPGITLAAEAFLPFLATKIKVGVSVSEGLRQLHVESLYLTYACARGHALALSTIERWYLPKLDPVLMRVGAVDDHLAEVKQQLRERLFTKSGGRPPRIMEYGGRSELGRWLRAVAVRVAIDLLRGRAPQSDRDPDELMPNEDDPELAHMKHLYRAEVAAATRDAFASLDVEARGDLRLYYLDGLRLKDLASLRRVAVSTMSRRLQAARAAVLHETRRRIRADLKIGNEGMDSILRLIKSRLDISRQWLDTRR